MWYREEYLRVMGEDCPFSPKYIGVMFTNATKQNKGIMNSEAFIKAISEGHVSIK